MTTDRPTPLGQHDNYLVGNAYGDILMVCTCGSEWTLAAPATVDTVRRAWDKHLEEVFLARLGSVSTVMKKMDAAIDREREARRAAPLPPAPEGFVQGRDDPGDRP